MIKSFKHKGLAEYFNTGSHRRVQAKHAPRLKLILSLLHAATHAGVMNAPGLGFHPLKGKPKRWAVSVDGKTFAPLVASFVARQGRWIGAKVGIFAVGPGDASEMGYADFDWFRVE